MILKCLYLFIFILASWGVSGQGVTVDHPRFEGRSTTTRNITRVELNDAATVVHFEAVYRPNWRIMVDSLTYITYGDGGEKMMVKRSEGIPLNEEFRMPEAGRHFFKLVFPPLPAGVTAFDWVDGAGYGIYGIALSDVKTEGGVPEELKGNWLKTDGSGEWGYAFEKDFAVTGNAFWQYEKVKSKGNATEFYLSKGNEKKVIYVRKEKDGAVRIGESKKNLQEYRRERRTKPEIVQKADSSFVVPVLRSGEAVFAGFIKGYVPQMGQKKGIVYVDDIFSGEQEPIEFDVQKDGRFEVKVGLRHPQIVTVRFPFRIDVPVLLEPGRKMLMSLDMEQYMEPWRDKEDVRTRPKNSLFMGDNALVNFEFQDCRFLYDPDYRRLQGVVKIAIPQEYKKYVNQLKVRAERQLAVYDSVNGLSGKGRELISNYITLGVCQDMLQYEYFARQNWSDENKGKERKDIVSFVRPELGIGYYDFLRKLNWADEKMLATGNLYATMVNWIKNSDVMRSMVGNLKVTAVAEELKKSGILFSDDEQTFLDLIARIQVSGGQDTLALSLLNTQYEAVNQDFNVKYGQLINDVQQKSSEARRNGMLELYFGVKPGLITEIMDLQDKIRILTSTYSPVTDKYLSDFRKQLSVPFIADYFEQANNKLKAKLEERKSKTGYVEHKIPAVEDEKLFEAIIEPFKGKAVFVDFWATWCSPCREGLKKMQGVKEDLTGKDIVFVYITGESSPLKTYENMIPDIKGHHFRLSGEQWDYLCRQFNIEGIPYYMLVDRSGKVVEQKYNAWKETDLIKKELLDLIDRK